MWGLWGAPRLWELGVMEDGRTNKRQHYELIPQPTLQAAEASLRSEITPFITLLLDRADTHLERQERRVETLRARAELQQGRLGGETSRGPRGAAAGKAAAPPGARKLGSDERLKARVVRQRKEALKYGVERLELEVLQKERELRKRLEG